MHKFADFPFCIRIEMWVPVVKKTTRTPCGGVSTKATKYLHKRQRNGTASLPPEDLEQIELKAQNCQGNRLGKIS